MGRYQIIGIRPDGQDTDRRIDAVKIGDQLFPLDQVIGWIQTREHSFFVSVAGRVVEVIVGQHPVSRRYYLTTEGDGFPPNNLLRLPHS